MSATEEFVEVSPAMIRAGVDALLEESYATPREELVSLIYMAMEYQRRKCEPATVSARK